MITLTYEAALFHFFLITKIAFKPPKIRRVNMDNTDIVTAPGTLLPDFIPFPVPSPDMSGVFLEIEVIVSDLDDFVILGCQHVGTIPWEDKAPCLVRYSDRGELDTGFGSGGYAEINLIADADAKEVGRLHNVERLANEGYLVRLEARFDVESDAGVNERVCVVLAQFTNNGQKDTAFGKGGMAVFPLEPPADVNAAEDNQHPEQRSTLPAATEQMLTTSEFPNKVLGDMKVMEDGTILVYASATNKELNHRTYILRVLRDGNLDTSLNGTGVVELKNETWFQPFRIGAQVEGGFVVSGEQPGIPFIARFHEDGELDQDYGRGGYFSDLSDYGYAAWHQLLALPDGDLVLVGHAGSEGGADPDDAGVVAVAKINSEGHRVPEFNNAQTVYLRDDETIGGFTLWSFAALIDKSSRIVIAGRRLNESFILSSFIARLKEDGSRDSELGTNGVIYHPLPGSFNALTEHRLGEGYYATGYTFEVGSSIGDRLYRIAD